MNLEGNYSIFPSGAKQGIAIPERKTPLSTFYDYERCGTVAKCWKEKNAIYFL